MKVKLGILMILPSGNNKRKKLSNCILLSSLLTVKHQNNFLNVADKVLKIKATTYWVLIVGTRLYDALFSCQLWCLLLFS